jgi:DNA polymerase-3 subunit gamma/tau
MSYLVLARKWRPRNFSEVAGQEHVLRALVNALDNDRLHHAFLFSGTRGVGKTTLARIFAKSINCERGVSSTPCGECSACVEVDEGRFVDLIEVDAASRTRVDDTRELLDNVQYAPTRGRYKVYLIDEVHMLSTHSFNALLKTLEEPPPHVKFLLATTDPQKLPVTVLSRCLQFNLKRLPPAVIQEQLVRIADAEGYDYDAPALHLLAAAADGSMRDALSLLDQAVAHAGGRLDRQSVASMLGTVERTHVVRVIQAVGDGDGPATIAIVDELVSRGLDPDGVLAELAAMLQQVALAQVVPEALAERVDDAEAVAALASALDPEAVQLWYQIALNGRRDLPLAPTPEAGLEMTLLRMLAFRDDDAGGSSGAAGAASGAAGAAENRTKAKAGRPGAKSEANAAVEAPVASKATKPSATVERTPGAGARPPMAPRPERANLKAAVTGASRPVAAEAPKPVATEAPNAVAKEAPKPAARDDSPTAADPGEAGEALPAGAVAGARQPLDWHELSASLGATGMLRQLVDNCVLEGVDGTQLRLQVDKACEHLLTPAQRSSLEAAVRSKLGDAWKVLCSVGEPIAETAARRAARERDDLLRRARESLRTDPYVRALESVLDARVIEETVRPREPSAETGSDAGTTAAPCDDAAAASTASVSASTRRKRRAGATGDPSPATSMTATTTPRGPGGDRPGLG